MNHELNLCDRASVTMASSSSSATTTSLLQPLSLFSSHCSSSSSSSSLSLLLSKLPTNPKSSILWKDCRRTSVLRRCTASGATTVLDPPSPLADSSEIKLKLLSIVSGLNKGLSANEQDLVKADAVAKELEAVGGLVDFSESLDKLQGVWKLVYSSAFSSRTLGGSRPGPPTGSLLPITVGQVFQRIDIFSKDFDNIVELQLGTPWPLPPVEVRATLSHKFELVGSAKIRIIFEKTTVKTTGSLSQLPPFDLPKIPDALRPPTNNTGSGEFEVTYQDDNMRITRGDRGELRVFVSS